MARIMVVEDDPIIRQTVDYALRRAGFETLASGDGGEALALAEAEHPDLVLLDLMLETSQLRTMVGDVPVRLRLKEFQLLVALAREPGRLMTRQRLAQEVWGYDHLPSSRTIDVHIRRVRQAVEEISAFTYIRTVHGVGYRFDPQPKESA